MIPQSYFIKNVYMYTLALVQKEFNEEARILSDLAWDLILSSDNSLDFNAEIWSPLSMFF